MKIFEEREELYSQMEIENKLTHNTANQRLMSAKIAQ